MVPLLTIGGRIAKGFDFLGYSFEPKGLSIAPKTIQLGLSIPHGYPRTQFTCMWPAAPLSMARKIL